MSRLGTGAAALLLLASGGCAPALVAGAGGLGAAAVYEERSTRDQIADFDIETRIEVRLGRAGARFDAVDPEVVEGRVVLTGTAPDAETEVAAIEMAWGPEGVRSVTSELVVAGETGLARTAQDAWIATQVRGRLIADLGVASPNYSVEVYDGVAHLIGLARSPRELERAAAAAAAAPGVERVVSHVLLIDDPRRFAERPAPPA